MAKNVIVTPLQTLEGIPVKKYIGFVFGSAVRELTTSDLVGMSVFSSQKRMRVLERVLKGIRHEALRNLSMNAAKMGANAVLGVHVHVWSPKKHIYEAYAYGTAVEVGTSNSRSRRGRGKQ